VKSCETLVARRSREYSSSPETHDLFDLSLLFANVCTAQIKSGGGKATKLCAAVGVSEESRGLSMRLKDQTIRKQTSCVNRVVAWVGA